MRVRHEMSHVHLLAFNPDRDLKTLEPWLHRPHVTRWWGDAEQAIAAVRQHPASTSALIAVDQRPVGYLCWQIPTEEELSAAGLDDLPQDIIDVDIMIGEPDTLGRGVGPEALSQLLGMLLTQGVQVVGLATAVANKRALRAYDKAGFRFFRDFYEAGEDMRYLVKTLHAAA